MEESIRAGKCKRTTEGKVVLPTGAMVSRSMPGACLLERIDEWHRQNPRQTAAHMLFEVAACQEATAPPVEAASYVRDRPPHLVQDAATFEISPTRSQESVCQEPVPRFATVTSHPSVAFTAPAPVTAARAPQVEAVRERAIDAEAPSVVTQREPLALAPQA